MIFDGVRDAYERLNSGRYRATGTYEVPGQQWVWELDLRSTFDLEKGYSHFFRKERRTDQTESQSYLQVFTPGFRLHWLSTGADTAGMHLPTPLSELSSTMRPRLMLWSMSMRGLSEIDEPFPEYLDAISGEPSMAGVVSVEKDDGLLRVLWKQEFTHSVFATMIWFDPQMNYVPVRYANGFADPDAPSVLRSRQDDSETEWELREGVAVPVAWSGRHYGQENVVSYRYSLSFEWKNVNGPVAPGLFTWRGAGLPEGTRVYDDRLGPTIEVGRVGMERPPEEVFANDPKGPPYLGPSQGLSSHPLWYLPIALSLVALAAIGFAIYKRRVRQ